MTWNMYVTTRKHMACMFVVLNLFCAFGLHALQVRHVHFESTHAHSHTHETEQTQVFVGEYLHPAEKKLFAVLVGAGIVLWAFLGRWTLLRDGLMMRIVAVLKKKSFERYSSRDYFILIFMKGVLHPKLH